MNLLAQSILAQASIPLGVVDVVGGVPHNEMGEGIPLVLVHTPLHLHSVPAGETIIIIICMPAGETIIIYACLQGKPL